jgi:hypothetical protein
MANRYWVGGTANWDGTAGTKWALTSGGTGGQAIPTASDDVFFDAASGAVTCTISSGNTGAKSITCTGFTGTLACNNDISVAGNLTLATTMTVSNLQIIVTSTGTVISSGKTISSLTITASGGVVSLGDALVSSAILLYSGTFTTNNYNVTSGSIESGGVLVRAINLGSSTVTLTTAPSITFDQSTNLTFNAGTSQINITTSSATFYISPGGVTFYNVSFTNTAFVTHRIYGANTFNNLTFAGRATTGKSSVFLHESQVVNGTLTLSAGPNVTCRTDLLSSTTGTTRVLTCAAVASLSDIDFADITIAGAAAPVSGTRLGDCKGNAGINFGAGVSKYWNLAGNNSWSATAWATSAGGAVDINNFPLAQDTAIFTSASPASGATTTVNASWNIGSIDMSARTSNTMTLANGTQPFSVYGNWSNGTGTSLSGTGTITFLGRVAQTIQSSGKTFTQPITINATSGSVTLLDSLVTSRSASTALFLTSGTFDANGYNVTLSGTASGLNLSAAAGSTLAVGTGTWTIAGSNGVNTTSAILSVTGSGVISLTSATGKTFAGGGIKTWPTLNQGGAGALTVTGSNKFASITNTYSSTGATTVLFSAGAVNEFTGVFGLTGTVGKICTLGSTSTTQTFLKKSSSWNVGANSIDNGNNTGLSFSAGGGIDYLSISYINGESTANGNFLVFF